MPSSQTNASAGRRAIAHAAHNAVDYLKKENVDFIKPHMCPPNSPDLNPVDYCGAFQQQVYRRRNLKRGGRTEESANHQVEKFHWQ